MAKYRFRLIADELSAAVISGLNQGHRQTTDSYLAKLAEHHGIKLATLEEALATRFPGFTEWVQ